MLVAGIRFCALIALLYAPNKVLCAGLPFEEWEHLLSSAGDSRPLSPFASAATSPSHVPSVVAPSIGTDGSWADLLMRHGSAGHITPPVDPSTAAAYDDLEQDLNTLKRQRVNSQIGSSNDLRDLSPAAAVLSDVQKQFWAKVSKRKKTGRKHPPIVLPFKEKASQNAFESYTQTLTRLPPESGLWPFKVGEKQFLLHHFGRIRSHMKELHDFTLDRPNVFLFGVWEPTGPSAMSADTYRYIGLFETPHYTITKQHRDNELARTVQQIESADVLGPSTARFKLAEPRKLTSAPQTSVPSSPGNDGPSTQTSEIINPFGESFDRPRRLDHISGTTGSFPSTVEQPSTAPMDDRILPLGEQNLEQIDDAALAEAPHYHPLPFPVPPTLTEEQREALLERAVSKLQLPHSHRMMKSYSFKGPFLSPRLASEAFAFYPKGFWVLDDGLILVRQDPDLKVGYAAIDGNMHSKLEPKYQLFLWKRTAAPDSSGYVYQLVGMIDSNLSSYAMVRSLLRYRREDTAHDHFFSGPDSIYDQSKLLWREKVGAFHTESLVSGHTGAALDRTTSTSADLSQTALDLQQRPDASS
ncbi:uncharacterized protein UTRI_02782 [Ustilago trichophora]|uniref:Uncharacterized protein n=1 Tax=Ustilago trichophora TaxID=86804 RepID=A0A5C3EQD9_9BASI|nr:uncharacterized protein UTRI_02782 [Ustilago trichophora]